MPTYTYIANGTRTDCDRARELLGDNAAAAGSTTIPTLRALLSDEHINQVLVERGSLALAVAWLADELVVRYAQKPGTVNLPSGLSVTWRERVEAWATLATRMRSEGITDSSSGSGNTSTIRIGRIIAGSDYKVR